MYQTPTDVIAVELRVLSRSHVKRLRKSLLDWFRKNARDLPWRSKPFPYQVWIAEMMLQQTQVKTVLPYYHRWMRRFPDIASIAASSQEEVLRFWEGLGYYSRALHVHRTSRIVVEEHKGEFPADLKTLLDLPGIGKYSAGAILSIAFKKDFPVVDGNVERIFARLFDISDPVGRSFSRNLMWKIAEGLLPKGRAGRFNQALMDLGATVCLPRRPLCSDCPAKDFCQAFQKGVVDQRPVSPTRKITTAVRVAVGVLEHEGRILIQKRPPAGLMANLWEFPGGKVVDGEAPEKALVREFQEELELRVACLARITVIRHNYTTFKVTLHAFRCELDGSDQRMVLRCAADARWVERHELENFPFPAANRKLIRMLS